MKIAISGSAGTGKTTLLRAVAKEINYPVIEEHYDIFFDHQCNFIEPAEKLQRQIFNTLEYKNSLETEKAYFVADRTPADLFNLWLSRGFTQNQRLTAELYKRCRACIKKYNYIIVLPWSALPLSQLSGQSTSRQRVMNPWIQLHNHAAIIGLLQQWVTPATLLPVPYVMTDIQSRVDFVVSNLSANKTLVTNQPYNPLD